MKFKPIPQNKPACLSKGGYGMEKENLQNVTKDSLYEGRDKAFMDIDRMINEGLSGGSVHNRKDTQNIEEAHTFPAESPPKKVK